MILTDVIDPPRLLIVDGDPAICHTLQHILHYYGYTTHGVTDGVRALELLLHEQFDMLLIDVRLAGRIDGQNLIQLAAMQQPDAVIVLLTATLDPATPYNQIDVRRFTAFNKTDNPATIVSSVERALARRERPNRLHHLGQLSQAAW